MKFRPKIVPGSICNMAFAVTVAIAVIAPQSAVAQERNAVVPTAMIFPGEPISRNQVTEVPVTNPNIAPGYADNVEAVIGKVSKKTLVAGRTIPLGDLRDPFTIQRAANVRITYSKSGMKLSASGTALEDAMAGDLVRVRNRDTGVTISGTAMQDGTVEVFER